MIFLFHFLIIYFFERDGLTAEELLVDGRLGADQRSPSTIEALMTAVILLATLKKKEDRSG